MRRSELCGKCGKVKIVLRNGKLRCKFCHNQWVREYYHRSTVRRLKQRRSYLATSYGASLEHLEWLLAGQNDRCAICCKHWTQCFSEKRFKSDTLFLQHLYVDHDHETGIVRGLLCNNCNAGIGLLDDDLRTLVRIIRYLNRHKKSA